jgi:hypothetical protein
MQPGSDMCTLPEQAVFDLFWALGLGNAQQFAAQRELHRNREAKADPGLPALCALHPTRQQVAKWSHFHAAITAGAARMAGGRESGRDMNFVRPRGAESDKPAAEVESNIRELVRRDSTALRQAETDSELAANNLGSLLRRVSAHSTREIDLLIGELRTLREKLANDGSRVEREIVDYAALSQSVIQLTKIIADGVTQVKKVPDAPSISE